MFFCTWLLCVFEMFSHAADMLNVLVWWPCGCFILGPLEVVSLCSYPSELVFEWNSPMSFLCVVPILEVSLLKVVGQYEK